MSTPIQTNNKERGECNNEGVTYTVIQNDIQTKEKLNACV